ncbi:MAG: hypothetical protein AB7H88_20065 [Vicinamibacterales bacterium]
MQSETTRRSLITGLGAAAAGVALAPRPAAAQPAGAFTPARHPQDAWYGEIPGKHRIFIDAATAHGAGEALLYANNLYVAQKAAYGLGDADIAMIVCLRHFATAFAFNDAIWAKYGKAMAGAVSFTDPKGGDVTVNPYNSAAYGSGLSNMGSTIDSLVARGTQFAVCDMATHFFAGQLAGSGGNADAVYKELTSNAIPNSHFVPAGVVGTTRAQEYGYSLLVAG